MAQPSEDHSQRRPSQTSHAQWWRRLFEASEEAQFVCERSGQLLHLNRQASRLLNLLHQPFSDDTLSFHLAHFFCPTTEKKIIALLHKEGHHSETLYSIQVRLGTMQTLLVDLQVTPLDEAASLVTLKDASRRWRLESHAQRLITAINATPDVVFLTDAEFRLTFANAAFQNATGYTIEEGLGKPTDFLRASSEKNKIRAYMGAAQRGNDWVGEVVNLRADGTLYTVESSISPIYSPQGHFLGAVAFERDLTAKKKLQEELLLERNFVRSILNSLESAVYTIDRNFRITHFNEGWKHFPQEHGWLHLEHPPRSGDSIFHYVPCPENRETLSKAFAQVISEGKPCEFRVSSDQRHWTINIFPWRHELEIRGIIYKVTDQTRFYELQNQLYQAQKMETIGALAAGVAHDFNNLLLTIQGNVTLLQQQANLDGYSSNKLLQIEQATTAAAEITQQLLSFSRPGEEQITIMDFNQLVAEAVQLARRSVRSKIHILHSSTRDVLPVRLDATRAQQVLLNLCINALDAMPDGGTLTITNNILHLAETLATKHQLSTNTPFVHCAVQDTGCGIPPEILSRIFDPFFTTKTKGKGTGLGLAIVHNVISKAGGFIEVQSTPGVGTTFNIYLPLCNDPNTPSPPSQSKKLHTGQGRILVVDDLELVLEFTRSFLEAAGYEVLTAPSAEIALRLLESESVPIDLLFSDYNMPDKNGWQLITEAQERWPHLKLVLASGYLDEQERKQVENNKAIRILNKPYHVSEATSVIAQLLQPTESSSISTSDSN